MLSDKLILPSPEQRLPWPWENPAEVEVWIKRDDLIHPIISGNKWRKLKHCLAEIQTRGGRHVLSFGGGYSNHIHALAYCCHQLQLQLTALIRGDYSANLTPMLKDCDRWGANLQFVDRATYKRRDDAAFVQQLQQRYPGCSIIPEGGSQHSALRGVAEIIDELQQPYDVIFSPVASGGTLAGLVTGCEQTGIQTHTQITGVAVLKGQGYLESLVQALLPCATSTPANWHIEHDFHFGGYAKRPHHLQTLCSEFLCQTGIPVEPVYSGKLIAALQQLLARQRLARHSRVLLLHTGGLQGLRNT